MLHEKHQEIKNYIETRAIQLGFSFLGFSHPEALGHEQKHLQHWLDLGYHAEMDYMENHFEKRTNPAKLHESTATIVSLLFNYFPKSVQPGDTYQVAKYAYGKDYHEVLKHKLHQVLNELTETFGVQGRAFTDSAPIMEREWARRAGLGWIGKHSLLINPSAGSYFLIAELFIDATLVPDSPFDRNFCGSCTKCMDACPTSAIVSPSVIDANKCLSYLTIEHRGNFTETVPPEFSDRIFGCDICQDVCPWNSKRIPHSESAFDPHPQLLQLTKSEWEGLSLDQFNEIFRKSAVKRTKYVGLTRNISKNSSKS